MSILYHFRPGIDGASLYHIQPTFVYTMLQSNNTKVRKPVLHSKIESEREGPGKSKYHWIESECCPKGWVWDWLCWWDLSEKSWGDDWPWNWHSRGTEIRSIQTSSLCCLMKKPILVAFACCLLMHELLPPKMWELKVFQTPFCLLLSNWNYELVRSGLLCSYDSSFITKNASNKYCLFQWTLLLSLFSFPDPLSLDYLLVITRACWVGEYIMGINGCGSRSNLSEWQGILCW